MTVAVDAVEDPRRRGDRAGPVGDPVVGRPLEALGGEADPHELVGRPPQPPPQAAVLAAERVVALARPGCQLRTPSSARRSSIAPGQ